MKCRLLLSLALLLGPVCLAETNTPVLAGSATPLTIEGVTNDPVELEYQKLMEEDDAAAAEVDGWILENKKFEELGAAVSKEQLNQRILKRFESVRRSYTDFIKRHPNHGRALLAYASFLEDMGETDAALQQMLKAKEVEPANPAAWNNLANYYGHYGEVTNAFVHYEKAIELDPKEPIYYHNFGTTVFLFRKDVMEHYGIDEQQVFSKALVLYSNSLALDPTNFLLATDIAMTYYGIKPPRNDEALKAWNYALKLADGSLQREGVYIHLARIEMNAGDLPAARSHLNRVTNSELAELKGRVLRNLEAKENPPPETSTLSNSQPAAATAPAVVPTTTTAPKQP